MFSKITIRTKLLVPTFTLIAVLLFLGFIVVSSNYATMRSLEGLRQKVHLSTRLSDAVHAFQKERGLTSGFLQEGGDAFGRELIKQRHITDRKIAALTAMLPPASADTPAPYGTLERHLRQLADIRAKVDRRQLSYSEAIALYSAINGALLQIVLDIAKRSHVPVITQNLLAYVNFLQMKEYTGLERAQGVALLSAPDFDLDAYTTFTNLIALQREKETMFLGYASPGIAARYRRLFDDHSFATLEKAEEAILSRHYLSDRSFTPKQWFDIITRKLNALDRMGTAIERDTTALITGKLASSKRFFYFVILLTLGSLALFFLMIRLFLKLAKEEQRLRFVMDKYIISSITDLKGRILDVSQAFCDISGYTRHELIGKNHNIVRHPDMPKEAFRKLWEKLKRNESWSGKVKNLKKDGSFYWVYAHIEPLYNAKGEKDSYISVRLDITETELLTEKVRQEEEKNRRQQALMQQQHRLAQMGEMLSMIAHQWRQPLSAISAATAALETKAKLGKLDDETALKIADRIKQVARHLSATIDDFRNFFKSDKNRQTTDFGRILESVMLLMEDSLKRHGIELRVDTVSPTTLQTYESELKQVVLNLLKNAEEALVDSGVAEPRIAVTIEGARMRVEDNGGGIDPEVLPRIFDPYFSTKTKKDGTGLGLYMSKIIVEEHCGGTLLAENGPEGARFTIDLGGTHETS